MILIADVDNCFVSCERRRNPELEGKPVIVLSSGKAAVIARSNEAKRMGIKMGEPYFKMSGRFAPEDYIALPADHYYYKQVSAELMDFLREECPNLFQYSIDEAFADMAGINIDLKLWGEQLHAKIMEHVKIPVSIGIAPSKTLAKIASHFAKHYQAYRHCCIIDTEERRLKALALTPIDDVWGVGRRYNTRLRSHGITTALDLAAKPIEWVSDHYPTPIVNTYRELNGIDCISMRNEGPSKSVSHTRTFPQMITDHAQLMAEVSNFAADCAATLRHQHTMARAMTVFVATNHYRSDLPQYDNSASMRIDPPTNVSAEITGYAQQLLNTIFRPGYKYKRAGVTITSVIRDRDVLRSLWENEHDRHNRQLRLDEVIDAVNSHVGRGTLRLGSQMTTPSSNNSRDTSPTDRPDRKG